MISLGGIITDVCVLMEASEGIVTEVSVHQKFFRGWIQWIGDTHVELTVVITGLMELILAGDRRLKEPSDSVECPMMVIGERNLVTRQKFFE